MKRHDDSAPRPSYQPIWELGSDERLLDPGPGALSGGCDVLVVAGGVIGLATAALCRRAGLGRVAVVERGRLAGGAAGGDGGDARGRGLQRGVAFLCAGVLFGLTVLVGVVDAWVWYALVGATQ